MKELNKAEIICGLMEKALIKIGELEKDRVAKLSQMDEMNPSYYLKAQEQLIQNWRVFVIDLKKHRSNHSSCVEDGAIVNIAGFPTSEWLIISRVQSSLEIEGTRVEIDDGKLGRYTGTLLGARLVKR